MIKDQLDGLLALKLVADRRSFTAAAAALRISPSAISQIIKQLESRLGVALLTRTTRSMSLTEAGERFLAQAGPAIEQILAAMDDLGTYAQKPSGLLRINLPRAVYPSYLAPVLTSFVEKYPDLTVELCFEDGQSDIVGSGFDAGIRLSDILAKDMIATKLFGPVRFVTAAAPRYLDRRGRPKHPKDLLSHNCIRSRLGNRIYDGWEFEQKGKEFQVQVKGSLIFNDSSLMVKASIDGSGVIYTAEDAIRAEVSAGRLEIVLASFSATSTGFYLYYPSHSQALPKLRAFIEHVKAQRAA
ncbi:MAG: LysR family transcriptional regulator [Gammaproteobacteria bacterium]